MTYFSLFLLAFATLLVSLPDITLENLMAKLECVAKSVLEWFHFNGMKLNSGKCHLFVCGHKFECMLCEIDNTCITFGCVLQSRVCKKASQKLNAS